MFKHLLYPRVRRHSSKHRQPRRRNRRRSIFEPLEDRRMLATLGVIIDRDLVLEYNGAGAANATILRDDPIGALTVTLASSDTTEIDVQPSVTMQDGQSSVVVPLDVIDDTLLDGTQTVTITASAPGFTTGSDTIDVRDIETLSLSVADDSLAIGGETTTATLTRNNTDVDLPLLVNIQDEHASDLNIPDQFEIPAGQQSVQVPISTTDNGLVEGTRTIQLVVFADGYLNGSDTLEIREDGVIGLDVVADGYAIDVNMDDSYSTIVANQLSDQARAAAQERRALFEFDISTISGTLDAASLTVRVQGYSATQGVGPVVEIFGYVGDGALSSADATTGQKVGEFQVPGDSGTRRYGIPLDLSFLQPLIDSAQHVGFSARIAQGSNVSFASSRNTFTHESNHPMLQFAMSSQPSPTAVNDAATTDEDVAVTINVLQNDFGDSLTVDSVGLPGHGSAVRNADNTITYSPAANFHGADSFQYTIRDAHGDTDTATVAITVDPVNDAPVAVNDNATTDEDTPVVIDVLANDSDVDNDTLSIDRVGPPANGTVVVNADNTVTYTPAPNFNGTDVFTYSMTDGNGAYKRAFVNVTVAPVNDRPELVDAVFALDENSENGTEVGRIQGSDVDGDFLSYSIRGADAAAFAINSQTGVISVADAALLDFETHPDFDFLVEAFDGHGGQAAANVHIDLNDVLEIAIDVLPADPTNTVSLRSKEIEVAIIATANFDPLAMIDLGSVRLRAEDSMTGAGVASHKNRGFKYEQRDVNGDGILDLVLKFKTSETGLHAGNTAVLLEGNLLPAHGGEFFSIEQAVAVEKGGGKRRR